MEVFKEIFQTQTAINIFLNELTRLALYIFHHGNQNSLPKWSSIFCFLFPLTISKSLPKFQHYYFVLLTYLKSFHCYILSSNSNCLFISKLVLVPGIQGAYILLHSNFCPSFVLSLPLEIFISFLQFS